MDYKNLPQKEVRRGVRKLNGERGRTLRGL